MWAAGTVWQLRRFVDCVFVFGIGFLSCSLSQVAANRSSQLPLYLTLSLSPTPLLHPPLSLSLFLSVWTDVKIISMTPSIQTEWKAEAGRQRGGGRQGWRSGSTAPGAQLSYLDRFLIADDTVDAAAAAFEPCLKLSFDFKPNLPIMRCAAKPTKNPHTHTHNHIIGSP